MTDSNIGYIKRIVEYFFVFIVAEIMICATMYKLANPDMTGIRVFFEFQNWSWLIGFPVAIVSAFASIYFMGNQKYE